MSSAIRVRLDIPPVGRFSGGTTAEKLRTALLREGGFFDSKGRTISVQVEERAGNPADATRFATHSATVVAEDMWGKRMGLVYDLIPLADNERNGSYTAVLSSYRALAPAASDPLVASPG